VDVVVEGSIFRIADRLQVSVQLIEGSTDRHISSETYLRDPSDVLTLQSDVALDIARAIDVALSPEESRRLAARRHVKRA
jgi:adenylate cyclase